MTARIGKRIPRVTALIIVALLAITVLTCSSCGNQSFSTEEQNRLDSVISDFIKGHNFPGVVVGAWVPEKGTYKVAKGDSDIKASKAMEIDDKFRIASVTKSFVGTVALQLVDEGKLRLDDNVGKYVPGVPNGEKITIRQLLNMTSGLYDYSGDEGFMNALASDLTRKWTPRELVEISFSHEPYFPPGQGWRYSNTNTILVGMIIEEVTSNKLEDEIEERIIDRLGLENTSFPEGPEMPAPYTHGYQWDEEKGDYADITDVDPSYLWAAGAMISSLEDLRVWAKALATGELISESMQKERLTFNDIVLPGATPSYEKMSPKYGLAIEEYDNEFSGHSGNLLGYNIQMYYLTSEKATLISMVNTDGAPGDGPLFFATISKIIFPDSFPDIQGSL